MFCNWFDILVLVLAVIAFFTLIIFAVFHVLFASLESDLDDCDCEACRIASKYEFDTDE